HPDSAKQNPGTDKQQLGPVAKMGPPEESGNSARQNSGSENKNSQGFQKFPPAAGGPRAVPPESGNSNGQQASQIAKLGPPEEQQDKSGDSSKQKPGSDSKKSQGWQKFSPPAGGQTPAPPENGNSVHQAPPQSQQQTPSTQH